jgi:8-oxo-dGTP pyrophosphatase MutT (NUDIX family)
VREFKEETGIDISVGEHLYTTDFYQPSAFNKGDQLVAIYYRVFQLDPSQKISLVEQEITAGGKIETLRFFWKSLPTLEPETDLTFPIDRIVARKFLSKK